MDVCTPILEFSAPWRERLAGTSFLAATIPGLSIAEVGTEGRRIKLHASVSGYRVTGFLATVAPSKPYFMDNPRILANESIICILGRSKRLIVYGHATGDYNSIGFSPKSSWISSVC
ncbi:hypothetical protein Trydic_g21690 [Trypoxylus dichotomus]